MNPSPAPILPYETMEPLAQECDQASRLCGKKKSDRSGGTTAGRTPNYKQVLEATIPQDPGTLLAVITVHRRALNPPLRHAAAEARLGRQI